MESAAEILAAQPAQDNLSGLGEWELKSTLVAATGRSADWLERHGAAGRIGRRLEVDQAARRVRTRYRVADVARLLEATP